jgi:uncharacterized protein (TIGR02058 family)
MTLQRMAVEFGMGTDLHGQDYTKAAQRALRDALGHNALTVAKAFGFDRDQMVVHVTIAVAEPAQVDGAAVLSVLPYGTSHLSVVPGGLEVAPPGGTEKTVVATAIAAVYLALPEQGA